ncbi:MAG: DUF6178 family protein [Pseudomonadota bacterium]
MYDTTSLNASKRELKTLISSGEEEKALDMILDFPAPALLVQSLSEEDFYWLAQELETEDAVSIFAIAGNDQWRYVVDMQVWDLDRLNMETACHWFALLFKAAPKRFINWWLNEDIETLGLYFFNNLEVKIIEPDQDPSELDDHFFTLDGVYYIHVFNEGHFDFVKGFLSSLAGDNHELYQSVILNAGHILPCETEEDAYRLRGVRLAEKGFLPFEEAIAIYQRLDHKEYVRKTAKAIKTGVSDLHPLLPYAITQKQNSLSPYLNLIEDKETIERLQIELAGLCNQIISADFLVAKGREVLQGVVRKAGGYLRIGLETLTEGDMPRSVEYLETYPLNIIFRIGYGRAIELKWRADKWIRQAWFRCAGVSIKFWGEPWEGILKGLMRKRPLFYTGLSEQEYREFESQDDIAYCRSALDSIERLDQLFAQIGMMFQLNKDNLQGITCKTLILTMWACYELGKDAALAPLNLEDIKKFFIKLREKKAGGFYVKEEMKDLFVSRWLTGALHIDIDLLNSLSAFFTSLFNELEDEYRLVSHNDLDQRFIKLFWLG